MACEGLQVGVSAYCLHARVHLVARVTAHHTSTSDLYESHTKLFSFVVIFVISAMLYCVTFSLTLFAVKSL